MVLGIKPTVDIVFKAVFGSQESTPITLDFVNVILGAAGIRKAASLEILNPSILGRFREDKDIVLDIRARDEGDREFQLEIQIRPFAALPRRMIQNWARCYLAKLRKGEEYQTLRPVISIWILGHEVFSDRQALHVFTLRDRASGIELGEDATIITIELPIWARAVGVFRGESGVAAVEANIVSDLDKWLYYLWVGDAIDPELPPAWIAGTAIREALETMAVFTRSERARDAYWRKLEFEMTQASMKSEARAEGLAEGRAQGRDEGRAEGGRERALEAARQLKVLGVELDIIAQGTGLSKEEVEKL